MLLYKPFRNIQIDIGVNIETIIHNWRNFRYQDWHVNRIPLASDNNKEDKDNQQEEINNDNDIDEWDILSHHIPPNTVQVSDIETLGH